MAANKGRLALDELSKEINASLKILLNLLQGRTHSGGVGGDKMDPTCLPAIQSEESQMYMDSSVAVKASASNIINGTDASGSSSELSDDQRSESHGYSTKPHLPSAHRVNRLQKIAYVLYGYKQKIHKLHQIAESGPGHLEDLLQGTAWNSMLHFEWLAGKKECVISALDVSVVRDCSFSESVQPFLCGADVEKNLHMILQMIDCGNNILLTGSTVS